MTIVLIHGLGSDRQYMLDVFGPALPAGERVIAPDVRAHGQSTLVGGPEYFALDALAAEVAKTVADVPRDPTEFVNSTGRGGRGDAGGGVEGDARGGRGIDPITVIGVSMGAAIALRIALRKLLPVRRALFVRPSFTDTPLPQNLRSFPVIGQLLSDVGGLEGVERFRESGLYADVRAASPLGASGLLAQFRYPLAVERAVRLVEVPRNRAFGSAAELAALDLPTAVVGARRDPVHPLEIAEQWSGGLGAPLTRLPARDDGVPAQLAELRAATRSWLASSDW